MGLGISFAPRLPAKSGPLKKRGKRVVEILKHNGGGELHTDWNMRNLGNRAGIVEIIWGGETTSKGHDLHTKNLTIDAQCKEIGFL